MAKLTNVRERVHQPFRDSLIRTSGEYASNVSDTSELFTIAGGGDGVTNQPNGSTLPSDQSMVVLALRVFLWFRKSEQRRELPFLNSMYLNGDIKNRNELLTPAVATLMNGSSLAYEEDVYRCYWQASEQILWSFGAGQKFSITSMPSAYFPYGGGLHGKMNYPHFTGDPNTKPDVNSIHWSNGMPDNQGILRLARAILVPPRQNVLCRAQIEALPTGGNASVFLPFQGSRNMLSCRDNLNVVDCMNKVVSFTFDGLFSRDVQ